MNKKVKLKGRLNMYMRWPVLLSALLLVATVLMYLVDYRAGLLMTACFGSSHRDLFLFKAVYCG